MSVIRKGMATHYQRRLLDAVADTARVTERPDVLATWQRTIARSSRWALAALLFAAVLAQIELARQRQPVRVIGPRGETKVIPRATADRLAARGKLTWAATVADAHEALGLPPPAAPITVTADTDHTALAGADAETPEEPR